MFAIYGFSLMESAWAYGLGAEYASELRSTFSALHRNKSAKFPTLGPQSFEASAATACG